MEYRVMAKQRQQPPLDGTLSVEKAIWIGRFNTVSFLVVNVWKTTTHG